VSYAEGTVVPVERSRAEIEKLVSKYGATRFASGWTEEGAAINFVAHGRLVRFTLPLPDLAWIKADLKKKPRWRYSFVPDGVMNTARDQEIRRRWRCLCLAIKSKLEVVETGIETFEQAFLANIVTSENITVYERIKLSTSGVKMLAPVEEEGAAKVIDIEARR